MLVYKNNIRHRIKPSPYGDSIQYSLSILLNLELIQASPNSDDGEMTGGKVIINEAVTGTLKPGLPNS